jgi:hypothetical protein
MWSNDWDDAAKHPRRTVAFMFLFGLLGGGAIGYWQFGQGIVSAIVLGVGCALILARISWRYSHDPDLVRRKAEQRHNRRVTSDLVYMGIGGAFILAGAADRNIDFVYAGIPLFAFGLAIRLIRRWPPK